MSWPCLFFHFSFVVLLFLVVRASSFFHFYFYFLVHECANIFSASLAIFACRLLSPAALSVPSSLVRDMIAFPFRSFAAALVISFGSLNSIFRSSPINTPDQYIVTIYVQGCFSKDSSWSIINMRLRKKHDRQKVTTERP